MWCIFSYSRVAISQWIAEDKRKINLLLNAKCHSLSIQFAGDGMRYINNMRRSVHWKPTVCLFPYRRITLSQKFLLSLFFHQPPISSSCVALALSSKPRGIIYTFNITFSFPMGLSNKTHRVVLQIATHVEFLSKEKVLKLINQLFNCSKTPIAIVMHFSGLWE